MHFCAKFLIVLPASPWIRHIFYCVVGKVWDFEAVDSADITGDMECFEMEPMNELKVGQDVSLRSIVKSCDQEEASIWYAQVSNSLLLCCCAVFNIWIQWLA